VLGVVVQNCIPQLLQLLRGRAFLHLTGNSIFPLVHLTVADELPSFIEAVDVQDIEPAFNVYYQ
jgi:hypothetical protein